MGAFWGGWNASFEFAAAEGLGKYRADKEWGPGSYGTDIAPGGDEGFHCFNAAAALDPGQTGYVADFTNSHMGTLLGRSRYGQHYILSKQGRHGPINVMTGRQLSKIYGSYLINPTKPYHQWKEYLPK